MPVPRSCARGCLRDGPVPAPCPTASARRPSRSSHADRGRSAAAAGSARRIPIRPRLPAAAAGRSRTRVTVAPIALRFVHGVARPIGSAGPFEIERNPLPIGRHVVPIQQQRPALVGDDDVEGAAIGEIGDRDRAAVVAIGGADHLRDVDEPPRAVADPHPLLLIAGEAARAHRRPVRARPRSRAAWPPATFEKSYQ